MKLCHYRVTKFAKFGLACFSLTRKCASETHSFDKGRTKKLNESPTLSAGADPGGSQHCLGHGQNFVLLVLLVVFGVAQLPVTRSDL